MTTTNWHTFAVRFAIAEPLDQVEMLATSEAWQATAEMLQKVLGVQAMTVGEVWILPGNEVTP